MKLVGATHGFIRKPFLFSGLTQGVFGALIGILLLMGALYGIQSEMPELLVLQDLPTVGVIMGGMLLMGMLMSLLATNRAVGKYLRMNEDDLYR
jgi:cell division transport system permease protein